MASRLASISLHGISSHDIVSNRISAMLCLPTVAATYSREPFPVFMTGLAESPRMCGTASARDLLGW